MAAWSGKGKSCCFSEEEGETVRGAFTCRREACRREETFDAISASLMEETAG
jgi:hypothetical protein